MVQRRQFIKKALMTLLGLLGLGFVLPVIPVLLPVEKKNKQFVFFPLIAEDEIPRYGVKKVELNYAASGRDRKARFYIVSSESGMKILSATCSHLGCLVNYHKEHRQFICPCHGGKYNLAGDPVAGPPPAPLGSLPFKLEKGMVLIGIKA